MYDVYLYGMIAASTVVIIADDFHFPGPNGYTEIQCTLPSIGGEAANSAIILSKLGLKTKLDGSWLNQRHSGTITDLLRPYNIDVTRLIRKEGFGAEEIVISDKTSRTVFGNYAAYNGGERQWNIPQETDIQNASIVSLDPYFKNEALAVSEMCMRNRKPYVTIDCCYDDPIAQNAEAVVISHELRNQAYGGSDMANIFENYHEYCQGLIIFTFGEDELWYSRPHQSIKKYTPYKIQPVDTTGAGDSFRSGIIYGLLQSWEDEKTIDFASAVAACVCLTVPHTLNAPDLEGVVAFMKNR